MYRRSHFPTVFVWMCLEIQFCDLDQYIHSLSGRYLHWFEYTTWIRLSTGRLCLDLLPAEPSFLPLLSLRSGSRVSNTSLLEVPDNSEIIRSMSLLHYHQTCYFHPVKWRGFSISPQTTVKLGSIRHFTSTEYKESLELAYAPNCAVYDTGWVTRDPSMEENWLPMRHKKEGISFLGNGWIRISSASVANQYRIRVFFDDSSSCGWGWLAQANHIFNTLNITANFQDYVFLDGICYWLEFDGPITNLPPGYLFLSPTTELENRSPRVFQNPWLPSVLVSRLIGSTAADGGESGGLWAFLP
ncbi:hypothetical protein B0H14DRAFT_1218555 [Mycena olivaceomarginata]|nr:hypothetical protein B0H14DRAFT_1218555 [Mycena olivaceomarginata]